MAERTWVAVLRCLLFSLELARSLERLPRTYHYNTAGERIGPEIAVDNPDHPDHPLHESHSNLSWVVDGNVRTVARSRRRLQGPPPSGGAPSSSNSDPMAMSILGTIALTTVAGTVANLGGAATGTVKSLPVGTTVYGPHEAGFTSQQDGVITSQMGCSTPSHCEPFG
eukprot:3097257-Prymnesium_polylepis.1